MPRLRFLVLLFDFRLILSSCSVVYRWHAMPVRRYRWKREFSRNRIDAAEALAVREFDVIRGSAKSAYDCASAGDAMTWEGKLTRGGEEGVQDRRYSARREVGKVRADTRSWRPRHVTATPAGLGPVAGPTAGRSPAVAAPRGCNAACVLSSPACSVGPCASRAADAAPGSPATRNWPRMCRGDGTRRWSTRRLGSSKRARSRRAWKASFRSKRWEIRHGRFS